MSSKYRRLLFIINYLILSQYRLIRSTNSFIELQEAEANRKVEELRQRQVEVDGKILDVWQGSTEELWAENEKLREEKQVLEDKIKKLERELSY